MNLGSKVKFAEFETQQPMQPSYISLWDEIPLKNLCKHFTQVEGKTREALHFMLNFAEKLWILMKTRLIIPKTSKNELHPGMRFPSQAQT